MNFLVFYLNQFDFQVHRRANRGSMRDKSSPWLMMFTSETIKDPTVVGRLRYDQSRRRTRHSPRPASNANKADDGSGITSTVIAVR